MDEHALSIIIPTLGRSTLALSLDSLLAQTDQHWRALVGFDGVPLMEVKDDSRITYYEFEKVGKENHGGEVRNRLIKYSDTSWVCFLDDDDTFRRDCVEKIQQEIRDRPKADVIVFRMSYDPVDLHVLPLKNETTIKLNQVGISFAVRKAFLQDKNLWFEPGAYEDFGLLTRIQAAGGSVVFINYIGYNVKFKKSWGRHGGRAPGNA